MSLRVHQKFIAPTLALHIGLLSLPEEVDALQQER
jgi:hypothetical protein